jgi:hypothetical protein
VAKKGRGPRSLQPAHTPAIAAIQMPTPSPAIPAGQPGRREAGTRYRQQANKMLQCNESRVQPARIPPVDLAPQPARKRLPAPE